MIISHAACESPMKHSVSRSFQLDMPIHPSYAKRVTNQYAGGVGAGADASDCDSDCSAMRRELWLF